MASTRSPLLKEGVGIVRPPSWQAEADLAAGRLVRLLADYEPRQCHCT